MNLIVDFLVVVVLIKLELSGDVESMRSAAFELGSRAHTAP